MGRDIRMRRHHGTRTVFDIRRRASPMCRWRTRQTLPDAALGVLTLTGCRHGTWALGLRKVEWPTVPHVVDAIAPCLIAGTVLFFSNAPLWWIAWMVDGLDEEPERSSP